MRTQVRRLQPNAWQSIFLVRPDGTAKIIRAEDWKKERDGAFMAVQAGPRLVIGGHHAHPRIAASKIRAA